MAEHSRAPFNSVGEYEAHIHETFGHAQLDVAVVGSLAIYLALPEIARRPNDIDLSVSEETYPHIHSQLISQPGWKETPLADGRLRLTNGLYDISTGWGMPGMHHEALTQRTWTTKSGLNVASFVDICPWKVHRNEARDQSDNEHIRTFLHSSEHPPLPKQFLGREMALLRECLPDNLLQDPDADTAIQLAANGIFTVFSLYGDPELNYPGHIVGELERFSYNVPALYHNGFELLNDIRRLVTHLTAIGTSNRDILDAVVAFAYADAVYGNGRESDAMPGGHDEYRAASLVRAHALALGYSKERAERLFTIVEHTGFNETTKRQKGRYHPDPVVRAACGLDLFSLSDPAAELIDICVENLIAARFSRERILGKVASEHNVRILSLQDGLETIDRYGHEKPSKTPNGPTVREVFIANARENATFHEQHEYPADWTLDSLAVRNHRATKLRYVAAHLEADANASLVALNEEVSTWKVGK